MIVLRAQHLGMCFGVRDAIAAAQRVAAPAAVTIYGDIVHNRQVQQDLAVRGFAVVPEADRNGPPPTPGVLITAHGISQRDRLRLLGAGKALTDTTCPLVRRVHDAARAFQRRGFFVIVIGKPGHVEVRGIVGDLRAFAVVGAAAEVRAYDEAVRLGIVCQSTTPPSVAAEVRAAIEALNPDKPIEFADTICQPTRSRQEAVEELLERVDALVVVGGKHSHNTRQLVRLAERRSVPVCHVEQAHELKPAWFAGCHVIGLTAGTSTPDDVIEEVERRLVLLGGGGLR